VKQTFAPSVFEFGKVRSFEGRIEKSPYPTLIVARNGSAEPGSSRYLLVAEGKHGADSQVAAFAGQTVQLRGRLIYRDDQAMIDLVSHSISAVGEAHPQAPLARELGTFALTGEIVDSKCYLGVMNPGSGKVHHDCAARCLSGGIPPVFATNDFNGHQRSLCSLIPTIAPCPRRYFSAE